MKKEFKKAAETAQPVTNENGTENQNINATATETTENGERIRTPETNTQTQVTTTQQQAPKAETIEQLQKRLDDELARLNHKRQLASNREKFIKSMGSLQMYIDVLSNEKEFETESGKLIFKILNTDNYDRTNFVEMFTVSNTDLIRKFCNMLLSEMQTKKTELEKQLLTA